MMDWVSRRFSVVLILKKVVQSVLERVDGGRLYDVRRKPIPVIDD